MKALVTGVAGFVGSSIAARLLGEKVSVVGIDSLTDYYSVDLKRQNLVKNLSGGLDFVEGDMNDVEFDELLDDVDVIFHQAGQPGVRKSWGSDFAIYTAQNVNATQRLLEAARRSRRLKRLVYASSSSVYGEAERYPTVETDRPQPISPYGVSKLAAEHLCTLYGRNFGVPTVSLRYFTVYGPRQRPDMAFTRFIRAALQDEAIPLFGTGEQIRDFTFIDDIVEANIRAATSENVEPGAVYNVAGGGSISVNGVLDILAGFSSSDLRIERKGSVAGDVLQTGGSIDAIKAALDWTPKVQIEEGLERQFAWGQTVFHSN